MGNYSHIFASIWFGVMQVLAIPCCLGSYGARSWAAFAGNRSG
jgi:hypothetical protein